MIETVKAARAQIDQMHNESLALLDEYVLTRPEARGLLTVLHRYFETWELKLLTERLGEPLSQTDSDQYVGRCEALAVSRTLLATMIERTDPELRRSMDEETPAPMFSETNLLQQSVKPL